MQIELNILCDYTAAVFIVSPAPKQIQEILKY